MLPLSVILGCGAVYVLNYMPVSWLCDYGQAPEGQLADIEERRADGDRGAQRVGGHPWKLVLSAVMFACGAYIVTLGGHGLVYAIPLMLTIWLLILIAIADGKYMIIPDQLVIFLILMAAAFIPFGVSIKDMLQGMGAGAGLMLLVAVVGYFISGRESLGFGDVKLMAAIGLITGLYECVGIMVVASIISGCYFLVGLARKKYEKGDMKPLGPFLCGVAVATLVLL